MTIEENPNLNLQMQVWQRLRKERGEDPYDWYAFCTHLGLIGAPYPGHVVPANFFAGKRRAKKKAQVIDGE